MRGESGARTISCPGGSDAPPNLKISGPEALLNLYIALDEDLTVLHPQLQIVLSDVGGSAGKG